MASCSQTISSDWRTVLAESVSDPVELCRILDLDPALADQAGPAADDFPLLAPRPYIDRMRPGDPTDPLLLQVLPQAVETAATPGYAADPLGETARLWGPCLLRKYQGRTLMVATGGCAVHCRFCFRRHFLFQDSPLDAAGSEKTLQNLAADRSVKEVILSGGDPLTIDDAKIARLIARIDKIPHLQRVRIHSRMPVVIPQRVTDDLISAIRGSRLSAIVVVHTNHPAEVDDAVARAFSRLIDAGIPVLNQSVLLRGVNDSADVLAELSERLVGLRVMPYYLHQLDRVSGAAHFDVPITIGREIMSDLRARLPGYAVPRYVRETPDGLNKEVLA